jgi:uncharacterized membrane protein
VNLAALGAFPVAVVTIRIHVLELVIAAVLMLLYLLVKVWRRI